MNPISEFIMIERDEYLQPDNNLFSFSFLQASRYYDFISIILERYKHASVQAKSKSLELQQSLSTDSRGGMTDGQILLFSEYSRLDSLVQLEIESFYLFAKILLDKIAFFLRDYFGEAKGAPFISHHSWQKQHEKFREEKGLIFPIGFSENIKLLQEQISDFRDDEITHKTNPRTVRGTTYQDEEASIIRFRIYPNERDNQITSTSLSNLMHATDRYIENVIHVIEVNRKKTRFHLKK